MNKISAPIIESELAHLKPGDRVLISGTIYCARDAAHKIMFEALNNGEKLPIDLNGQVVYYAGPTPPPPGKIIGSCGPTTSGRMDKYTPLLLEHGLKGMIGKGERSVDVCQSIAKNKAIYFSAIGGAGALVSKCVKSRAVIAYEHLGSEALTKLEVVDFPCIVSIV